MSEQSIPLAECSKEQLIKTILEERKVLMITMSIAFLAGVIVGVFL